MKKILFLFFIFILLCSNTIDSQSKKKIRLTKLNVNELIVSDSIILKGIDSFIFDSPCEIGDNYKYFNIRGEKLSSRTYISFHFYLYDKIEINKAQPPIGFFEYKGYTFFVFDYYPNEIFINSQKKKEFSLNGASFGTDPFGLWELSLEKDKIQLEYICCRRLT